MTTRPNQIFAAGQRVLVKFPFRSMSRSREIPASRVYRGTIVVAKIGVGPAYCASVRFDEKKDWAFDYRVGKTREVGLAYISPLGGLEALAEVAL